VPGNEKTARGLSADRHAEDGGCLRYIASSAPFTESCIDRVTKVVLPANTPTYRFADAKGEIECLHLGGDSRRPHDQQLGLSVRAALQREVDQVRRWIDRDRVRFGSKEGHSERPR